MMEIISMLIDFILHFDKHLAELLGEYGTLTYGILIAVIFVETGFVIMPLLPGDSLLFAVGALSATTGQLDIHILIITLIIAALAGDNMNYFVGKFFGKYVKQRQKLLFLKQEHLQYTENFYESHGGKTVIMARFIPIVRTVAPFVAGTGSMPYTRYILFCVLGAILWVVSLSMLGYQFGQLDIVKRNFELVILSIIFISILPILFHAVKAKFSPQVTH